MSKLQQPENGSSSADAVSKSRDAQHPQQLSEALALLKQDIREREHVEESLRHSKETLLLRLHELEQRDRDQVTLGKLGNYLNSSVTSDEACAVITAFGPQLLPADV